MQETVLDGAHDSRQLRQALGRFATGVTVITTFTVQGQRLGLTANSFSALSLEPPLVLWSMVRRSGSTHDFMDAGRFAINVLSLDQADVSHHFATSQGDRFGVHDFEEGMDGLPLLCGALASFECQTDRLIDGGDHVLFVGRVKRIRWRDGQPLVFSAGRYCSTVDLVSTTAQSDLQAIWNGLG
jgi:flavin reductase (DIM6/NTAB) family NADH-FMN oxidoreductase RutF